MPLEVHHLHLSQSERIVWMFEELKLPYDLHVHERDPQTGLAPQSLKDVSPFGTAPYFRDTNVNPPVALSESSAIVEYVLAVYGSKSLANGGTRLIRTPDDSEYGQYLQWLHFVSGTLQPSISRGMLFLIAKMGNDNPLVQAFNARTTSTLKHLDDRLADNKYLAGEELSAADILSVVSLTTIRGFNPKLELGQYHNILRYLKDVAARPAYQEALRKGDHGMEPMITPKVKGFTQFATFRQALQDE